MRRSTWRLAAALAAAAVVSACTRPAPPARRVNVLVVTVDTLRADRLGCYGFGLAHTPAVDQLAREGVRCTDTASSAPITLPAHSSIMTGLFPPAHGVRDNGNYALGTEAVTLAERLKAEGYRTGAFVSAAVLARRYGLDQGFDVYDDDLWAEDEPPLFMIRERSGARTADHALAWLAQWNADGRRQPFFLWTHFFDPHQPYEPRSLDLSVLAPTAYDAEVAEADRAAGRIIDWLRREQLLDDTLVVFTADHGESLGEHGEPTHGIFIYDATIHVPLVWRLPGTFPAGRTYAGPVRHVDIVPTILAVLGLAAGRDVQGADLLAEFRGEAPVRELPQYSEARLAEEGFGMAPLFGVREAGRKWIQAPRPELYDLTLDPREKDNLYPRRPEEAAPLEKTLETIIADSGRRALTAPTREIDRETEEMLRALGYLAPPEERAGMAGRDPKDGIKIYAKLQAARQMFQVKQMDRADALLAEVLAEVPENVTARNLLALSAVRRGDYDEADLQYRESLKQQPRQHRVMGALGALALRRNDLDAAQKNFEDALALAPTFVEAMSNLGFVLALRGDTAGAQAWYEKSTAIDPTYPHTNRRLGDLYYDRKEYGRALDYYRRVLTALPRYFDVLIQAGNAARFQGNSAEASRYYAEAGTVRPDSWIPPYNLACLQAIDGQADAAIASLEQAVKLGFENRALLDANDDFQSLHGLTGWSRIRKTLPERRHET